MQLLTCCVMSQCSIGCYTPITRNAQLPTHVVEDHPDVDFSSKTWGPHLKTTSRLIPLRNHKKISLPPLPEMPMPVPLCTSPIVRGAPRSYKMFRPSQTSSRKWRKMNKPETQNDADTETIPFDNLPIASKAVTSLQHVFYDYQIIKCSHEADAQLSRPIADPRPVNKSIPVSIGYAHFIELYKEWEKN